MMSSSPPSVKNEEIDGGVRVSLLGGWTVNSARLLESRANIVVVAGSGAPSATIDLGEIEQLDTAGAWVIDSARVRLDEAGVPTQYSGGQPDQMILLKEAHYRLYERPERHHLPSAPSLIADMGESVYNAGDDLASGLAFLGRLVSVMFFNLIHPKRWRVTSTVFHIESFALRSVPIIVLINFLVGAIVAQQGIFQLKRFGATEFVVDLIGILVLRELGVLLTSIMIAGRSGSAITAEIGSMKMREEVDALSVMALDPVEVLIVPRVVALIIALPILTFLADMAALFGGLCVAWVYGGISPEVFLGRLQSAIAINTFAVGLIKAPFMALVIALIASVEGFAVRGSAESLGRQVTSSVVKSIFTVIFVDGLFAMFFAAIHY
jgi:phospholipid/cholesterol/gamma-HCH transport system permease protein